MRRRLLATTGLVGVLVVSLLTGTVGQAPVQAAEVKPGKLPPVQTSPDVNGRDLPASARKAAVSSGMAGSTLPPGAVWPDAKSAARVPAGLAARFLSRAETKRLGVPGVVLGVKPTVAPEGRALTVAGKTRVEIDYSGFARAVGGDWASRLRLVTLTCQTGGECVEDVPLAGLKNDLATKKISGELVFPKATTASAAPSETLVAAMAAASGPEGSFEATSLAPTSSWQVSTQTGDFSWSYPMRVPPLTFGSAPDLSISYSSGSVDGQAAATNNQASWVGLGHTLEPGYIERRYSTCADDMEPLKTGAAEPNNSNHKTNDLCWNSNNATLVLGGRSTELIYIASSSTYKLKNDDGSKLENLAGAPNSARAGEHWRLTTTDGTQYYFGLNPVGYGDARANSVSTVPVFGNHPGEPCYVQGNFGASYLCSGDTRFSAWRWNVDYVVDTDQNTTTYRYVQEENTYGRNQNTGVSRYQRGSYLSLIEYGERVGANSVAPPARVRFDVDERCIPSSTFACDPEQLTADNASRWPDVPFDQICTSTTTCPNRTSPSFFTRKRLASINTEVWSGTAMRAVDTWTLAQQMYDSGGGSIALWLDGITHQGRVGGTATLPMVKLTPIAMPNRAKGFDALGGPMNRPRIKRIHSESGSVTEVTYSAADCGQNDVPANESANTRRCYPVFWVPPNMIERKLDWFNKYVVTQVIEDDLVADSTSRTTSYEYVGSPAWHYSEDELLLPKYRTWSEFRGYSYVNVRSGGTGWQTQARSLYMRGMHGDRIKGSTTRKSVTVTDTRGGEITDVDRLNGYIREQITYNGSGGAEVSGTINSPWLHETGREAADPGEITDVAQLLGTQSVRTRTRLADGSYRTAGTDTEFDTVGMPTQVNDVGDVAVGNDDRCTRYTYNRNTDGDNWILAAVSREETVSISCAVASPDRATQLVSDVRSYFDDSDSLTAKPTRGHVTKVEAAKSWSNGAVYAQRKRTVFDGFGRIVRTFDGLDRQISFVEYIQDSAGAPVDQVDTTDAKGFKSKTFLEPAWGLTLVGIDANNGRTENTYDPLGRLTGVWLPDRSRAGGTTATARFEYAVSQTAPNVVTSYSLLPSGSYTTSKTLFDGLMRERQKQSHTATGVGRLVTDTMYNSRGGVYLKSDVYYNSDVTGPSNTVFQPWLMDIPAATEYTYDGANRETNAIYKLRNAEAWRTTTTYGGDRVKVLPPVGGVVKESVTDVRGNKLEERHYHGRTATTFATTKFTYTARDEVATVTDNRGTEWEYSYDLLGRKTSAKDPDKGLSESTYDDGDRITSAKDARGKVLAYAYDAFNRKTTMYDGSPTGTVLATWTFDTLRKGALTSSSRYVNGSAYTTAVTGYDALGRPTGGSTTIPAVEGKLAGTYTTTTSYKPDGSVYQQKMPNAPGVPSATLLETRYTAAGQPDALMGYQGYVAEALYLPTGEPVRYHLASMYGKSVWKEMTYEEGTRRLKSIRVTRENLGGEESFGYTYDNASNVTSVTQIGYGATDRQCFKTDYERRIIEAWTPNASASLDCSDAASTAGLGGPAPYWQSFSYDSVGVRTKVIDHKSGGDTTRTYGYPAATGSRPHAATSVTSTGASTGTDSYEYDAAGNLTGRTEVGKPKDTFDWDVEGRLASVTATTGSTSMVYSADGQRLIRRDPTGATLYLPSTEVRWTKATDALSSTQYYSFNGTPVAIRTGVDAADLVIADPYGTGQIGIDAYTQDYSRRRSDLFGNVRQTAGPWEPTSHGFVDGVIDASTRLTHLGAREYDSKMGRFISVDPVMDLSDPQSLNGYTYGNSNPLVYTDPTGTQNQSEGGGSATPKAGTTPPPPPPVPDPVTDSVPTGSSKSKWEQLGEWNEKFDRTLQRKAREILEDSVEFMAENPTSQKMAEALGKKFYEDTKEEFINWATTCGSASNSAVCKIQTAGIAFWFIPGGGQVAKPAIRPVMKAAINQAEKAAAKSIAAKKGPSAQEIIQSTARGQASRGVDALKGSLSAAERAAMDADPGLTSRMLGQAVHRSTARELNRTYPGRFEYSTRGPDFVDRTTGEMLELTTPGQVGSHLARPGYRFVAMCTYTLPAC